jgi:hypothetical protein
LKVLLLNKFWQIPTQTELDLLVIKNGKKWDFEIKYHDAPKVTVSMRRSVDNLDLQYLFVTRETGCQPGFLIIKEGRFAFVVVF